MTPRDIEAIVHMATNTEMGFWMKRMQTTAMQARVRSTVWSERRVFQNRNF